jgi:glutamate dehydrogenase/leucine dehydrogenase
VEKKMSINITVDTNSPDFDLYEAIDEAAGIYSCVYIFKQNWNPGWPALGGTRNINGSFATFAEIRGKVQEQSRELAASMAAKNKLLRDAAQAEAAADGGHAEMLKYFGWNGGKGVIWSPDRAALTPERLMRHGELVQAIGGQYLASMDAGVHGRELRWIERATQYTIGNGCQRSTGEGTAAGTASGIVEAVHQEDAQRGSLDVADLLLGTAPTDVLKGKSVLVVGLGSVGLPLALYLHRLGAEVFGCELDYKPEAGRNAAWLYRRALEHGNAVGPEHERLLLDFERSSLPRLFGSEEQALRQAPWDIVSPNGSLTNYLATDTAGRLRGQDGFSGTTRAELLAGLPAGGRPPRLIIGASNDQLPATRNFAQHRESALQTLAAANLRFIPDPVVSPGGVIAVSHELSSEWKADNVVRDACRLVRRSVKQLYARCQGATDAVSMYRTFEALHGIPM